MLNKIVVLVVVFSYFVPVFAETIELKSGKEFTGKIIENNAQYVKIDYKGTPVTFFRDEIKTIDGKEPISITVKFDNPEMAIAFLKEQVKNEPHNYLAFDNLGLNLAFTGKLEEAVVNFKKAVEINPGFSQGYAHLGATYVSLQNPKEATPYLEKAVQLGDTDLRTFDSLAACYYFTGKIRESIPYFEKVLQGNPKNIKSQIAVARAYKDIGNKAKARENFLKLKELFKAQGDNIGIKTVDLELEEISE